MDVWGRKGGPLLRLLLGAMASLLLLSRPAIAAPAGPKIVLIGGAAPGYAPGEHDYPSGIRKIAAMIEKSPEFAKLAPTVKAFPEGFPEDLAQLDDAAVVVLYLGMKYDKAGNVSVLADPAIKRQMQTLMDRGVGLVVLHQSFTVPDDSGQVPLPDWIGAVRVGMADRATQFAPLTVASRDHPVARGLAPNFHYIDEFYPTIRYAPGAAVTPVLGVKVHVQFRDNKPVFDDAPTTAPAAFAYERPGGGRSFAFTGAHYLSALDQPEIRKMVLNAIFWAAKGEVPAEGVTTAEPAAKSLG